MRGRNFIVIMRALAICTAMGNPIALPHTTVLGDGPIRPKPFHRRGLYRVEVVNVETNGGQILQTTKHTRMTTRNSASRETDSWTEVVVVKGDDREIGGLISGKDFCGLVFGDIYPDKCAGVKLSTPFFLFDEFNITYNQSGALVGITSKKEIDCRYGAESVMRMIKEIKAVIEGYFDVVLAESDDHQKEGHADPDELVFYDTGEISKKKKYFCKARISAKKNIFGKHGRRLPKPSYTLFMEVEDLATQKGQGQNPPVIHDAVLMDEPRSDRMEFGKEELPSVLVKEKQISRPYPQEDIKRSVANQPHYDWGDIENRVVVGTEACRAAVELQKKGSHMRTLSLRDKEIAQEAVVELANRIDALEKEIKALKANQKP